MTIRFALSRAAHRTDASLWVAVLAPPLAWLLDLGASYALVPLACKADSHAALHVATATTLALALGSGALAWRELARLRGRWTEPPDRTLLRERFMARAGIAFALFFAGAIAATAIPSVLLGACS